MYITGHHTYVRPSLPAAVDPQWGIPQTNDDDALARELVLDIVQMGLDIAGIIDPSPICDGASGLISLSRGDWLGAGISVIGMAPYVGDVAKLGKLGRYGETLTKALELAQRSPAFAKAIAAPMKKLREAFADIPLEQLPAPVRDALGVLKDKINNFARISVHQIEKNIGKNKITWSQNAFGETIGVRATLRQVFYRARRDALELKAQTQAAGRGINGDVGGHIIGHRFAKDQGIHNLFPQNANFNNSAYKKIENEWADWINKKGGSVEVDIKLIGDSSRPDTIDIMYVLMDSNGRHIDTISGKFKNTSGQIFHRHYFK